MSSKSESAVMSEKIDKLEQSVGTLSTKFDAFLAKFEENFYKNDKTGRKGIIVEHDEIYSFFVVSKKLIAFILGFGTFIGVGGVAMILQMIITYFTHKTP